MARPQGPENGDAPRRTVSRQATTWFTSWSVVALLACAVLALPAVHAVAADIALRDASLRGASFANNVAAPLVNQRVRAGDRRQLQLLETVMRNRMRDGSLVRIKIWAADGTIIWSDVSALNGAEFPREREESELFGSKSVIARFSDLSKPDHVQERPFGEVLEVSAGTVDADNQPIVVESYWPTERITREQLVMLTRMGPLILGVLVVFMLAILPLAFSLARRVDRAQAQRTAMLGHALAASDLERRRISRELHDGLIQDLTSLGYVLPTVASELPPEASSARAVLESVRSELQADISALRSILSDIYPTNLAQEGLVNAIEQLAAPAREQGLHVDVVVDEALEKAPAQAIQLTYQVMREGLHNVVKHAHATRATLVASTEGDDVVVTITDDGVGPPPTAPGTSHLGVRMLQDDVADIGGQVTLRPMGSGGAQLTARFPLTFEWAWAR